MALVKTPLKRAHAVSTPLQARRLRDDLEIELALNNDLPAGWENEADQAVDVLNERYGRAALDKIDPEGAGAKGWSPSASAGAKKGLDGPKPSPKQGPSTRDASRRAGGRRQTPTSGGGRPRGGARRGRGGGLLHGRAAEQTGIPSAVRSASQLALQTLGLLIFLSLVYLILAGPRGKPGAGVTAVETFARSVGTFVNRLIAPVDPLRGRTVAATTRAVTPSGAGSLQDANAQIGAAVGQALGKTRPSTRPRPRGAVHPNP